MRMARPAHILRTRTILQRQRALSNHLTGIRSDNVHAQDTIRLGIGHELDQAIRIQVRLGPAVRRKGKAADLVLDALLLELGLSLPDPGDFRVRVHDGRDGVVVDVAVGFGEEFDGRDRFFFRFVGEHGPEGAVADDADVGVGSGTVFRVDDETAAGVGFEADVFEPEAGCVGTAADGNEDDVGVELL